jgi:23S rRNA pseudouridine1911/1915/1917 synthase
VEILYVDEKIVVCIKPAGVPSTDEPGGLPELVRQALGDPKATVKTVHRLDQVVSGVMVLARTARAASDLSEQIRNRQFEKTYLAEIHGCPAEKEGTFRDLLWRSKPEKKTYIVTELGKDVQEAVLDYRVMSSNGELSRVRIQLHTGRTHQIRAQFSGRGFPLIGDKKYGRGEECNIALWSHRVAFFHPKTGAYMEFTKEPPAVYPWTEI